MGGRKSYSIKTILRKDPEVIAKEGALTKSFQKEDLNGIARGSADLLLDINDLAKILIYSKKLLSAIVDRYDAGEANKLKDLFKIVRIEWAKKKEKESLESNRIIDVGVIDAVSRALREIKK